MLVKMRMSMSGLRDGQPWPPPGGSIDLPDEEAVTMCANGSAVPVHDPESGVERAVLDRVTPDVPTSAEASSPVVEARETLVPQLAASVPPATAKRARPRAPR